jgi:hypothetical protein
MYAPSHGRGRARARKIGEIGYSPARRIGLSYVGDRNMNEWPADGVRGFLDRWLSATDARIWTRAATAAGRLYALDGGLGGCGDRHGDLHRVPGGG